MIRSGDSRWTTRRSIGGGSRYAPELEQRCRPHLKVTTDSWRVDETYVKVKKVWMYLYRAVDSQENTLEFLLSNKRYRGDLTFLLESAFCATYDQSSDWTRQNLAALVEGLPEITAGEVKTYKAKEADACADASIIRVSQLYLFTHVSIQSEKSQSPIVYRVYYRHLYDFQRRRRISTRNS
jgi:hypothetical protein